MNIAILDSGIDNDKKVRNIFNYVKNENRKDQFGHGTMCYNIISYYNCNANIDILKVLDKYGRGNANVLYRALNDLIGTDIDIINLSLSLSEYNDYMIKSLKVICERLLSEKKVIVCSHLNTESNYSFPADIPSIVGVKGINLKDESDFICCGKDNFQVLASGIPVFTQSVNTGYSFFKGNSKATATMTGILSVKMQKGSNIFEILFDKKNEKKKNEIIANLDEYKSEILSNKNIDENLFMQIYKQISHNEKYQKLIENDFLCMGSSMCDISLVNSYFDLVFFVEKIMGKKIIYESLNYSRLCRESG